MVVKRGLGRSPRLAGPRCITCRSRCFSRVATHDATPARIVVLLALPRLRGPRRVAAAPAARPSARGDARQPRSPTLRGSHGYHAPRTAWRDASVRARPARCAGRTAGGGDGGPLRLLRRRNPPPRLRALHPHPARGWPRACSARCARCASVAGGPPAAASFALMAFGHQRGARLPLLACSPRQGRLRRRLRRLRCAQALPGLCALAGRAVGARGRPGPVTGLGPSGPSAFAGRVSARPAATPPHWPARVAAPRPCASRRAGPGGCPACGPGRACGPRIFSRALLAGCLRCAQATRPFALRARRLRWCGLWPRTFVRVFTCPPAAVAGGQVLVLIL